MNAAQDDQTFEDGLGGVCVLQALHGCPESSETQSVVWTLEPAPHIFIDIVCFVKGGLVRFVGMPKFRVKKSLSKITRTLEALIEAVEAHQDLNSDRVSGEQLVRMFYQRCNPEGSYVLRFGANNSQLITIDQ